MDSCDDDRGAQRENEILKDRPGESDTKKSGSGENYVMKNLVSCTPHPMLFG